MDKISIQELISKYKNNQSGKIDDYFPLFMNDRLQSIFRNQTEPKEKDYQDVADIINTLSGTNLEAGHIKSILDFYPYIKAKIAFHSVYDPILRDLILDTISDFMLGCNWMEYDDNVDEKDYIDVLNMQVQAFIQGFKQMMELKLITSPAINDKPEYDYLSEQSQDEESEDKIILSDKTYKHISKNLEYYSGVPLSKEEVDKLLEYAYLKPDIVAWGVSDTVVADNLIVSLFKYYLNEKFDYKDDGQRNRLKNKIEETRRG